MGRGIGERWILKRAILKNNLAKIEEMVHEGVNQIIERILFEDSLYIYILQIRKNHLLIDFFHPAEMLMFDYLIFLLKNIGFFFGWFVIIFSENFFYQQRVLPLVEKFDYFQRFDVFGKFIFKIINGLQKGFFVVHAVGA